MKVALWIAGGVVLAIGLSIGGFALSVALSGPVGRGQQIKQVNSAVNRTGQYNHFFDLRASYETDLQAIKINSTALKALPPASAPDPLGQNAQNRSAFQLNVTGAQTACATEANQYNEDSQKTTTGAQFKAWALPPTLDSQACEVTP